MIKVEEQDIHINAGFLATGGGGGEGGTTDYNKLTGKPSINKNTLQGNKTGDALGLVDKAQGTANQGKILSVASDGNLSLSDPKESMSGIKYTEPEELFDVIEFNNINYDTDIKNVPTLNGVSLKGTLTSESVKVVGSQQNKSNAGKVLGIDVNGKVVPVNAGGGSAIASGVLVDNKDFQILTGANVQVALKEVDTKLALNEDYDSILLSLDVLNKDIGGGTELPLSSLQTQLIDGRPSHKAPGSMVYDEFGTIGILDHITGQNAYVTTVTVSGGGVSKNYVDQELAKKSDKVNVKIISNGTTALVDNTILRALGSNALTNLTITIPSSITADFTCELNFTSGDTATAFTAPATIKWFGDDTESGALVPQAKTRYVIMFYYEGTTIRAISQKAGV